jgi:hypothetical protein
MIKSLAEDDKNGKKIKIASITLHLLLIYDFVPYFLFLLLLHFDQPEDTQERTTLPRHL